MPSIYEKVISFIQEQGPSLPSQVAKMLEKDTFFAGAILSDLLSKKAIRITTAKIGSSPLYYLPDQKEKLSMLYDKLPLREREAYDFLKEKKIVKDSDTQPSIRVALRMLKDFAIPTQINSTLVWRWYLTPEIELQKKFAAKTIQQQKPVQQKLPKPSPQPPPEDTFAQIAYNYLTSNNVTIEEKISQRKNREVILEIKVPSALGPLDMLAIAKNKKRISDSDLSLAHQKGQTKKLPVLFLTTGELTKKALAHIEKNLKGYITVKKLP